MNQEAFQSGKNRWLIVNADDFGLSEEVNRGIIQAHEQGIVTSASLMVRSPFASDAANYSKQNQGLSIGLHADLFEWVFKDGNWMPLYEVVPADDAFAVADELSRQLDLFRDLVGRNPTHLDSHQHAHNSEPVRSELIKIGHELNVPIRHFSEVIKYNGNFYGQTGKGDPYPLAITRETLKEIIKALPIGITELACHPGFDDQLDSIYARERAEEVKVLCDAEVKLTLAKEKIYLTSFSEVSDFLNSKQQTN
jgi:predicted glycoside hydrolase/deacetylase ChbG (UPF0249 family)